ncbi:MAG: hypothetical protein ACRDIV_00465, partial [Ktedonobacteraceae bacterium]
ISRVGGVILSAAKNLRPARREILPDLPRRSPARNDRRDWHLSKNLRVKGKPRHYPVRIRSHVVVGAAALPPPWLIRYGHVMLPLLAH